MYDFLFLLANPVGLLGVLLLLIAYFFLSTGRWLSDSMIYQIYNLLGALLILYSLIFYWNLSSFVIEIAWVAISLIGIYRIISGKKKLSLHL
ncbi:MAG: hypothetical protein ABI597_04810 [Gammaproteobacteria bacterium]